MKTLLLATTMLATTAGLAAAEVTLSGDARMGVVYDDFFDNSLSFNSRARVAFSLSGETDNGLSFGASFRADNASNNSAAFVEPTQACLDAATSEAEELNCAIRTRQGGAVVGLDGAVFLSGAFGKISMGDVSSAAENAVGDLAEVGYTGFSSFGGIVLDDNGAFDGGLGNEMQYVATGDDEMALYEYSTGDVSLYVSVGQPGDGQTSYSLGARYDADTFGVALGYEDLEDEATQVIGGVYGVFSGVTLRAIYGAVDGRGDVLDVDQYGLSASYTMDALTVDAFWRKTDVEDGREIDAYGIGATYDLGGGAAIEGGIGRLDDGSFKNVIADLGVTFEF